VFLNGRRRRDLPGALGPSGRNEKRVHWTQKASRPLCSTTEVVRSPALVAAARCDRSLKQACTSKYLCLANKSWPAVCAGVRPLHSLVRQQRGTRCALERNYSTRSLELVFKYTESSKKQLFSNPFCPPGPTSGPAPPPPSASTKYTRMQTIKYVNWLRRPFERARNRPCTVTAIRRSGPPPRQAIQRRPATAIKKKTSAASAASNLPPRGGGTMPPWPRGGTQRVPRPLCLSVMQTRSPSPLSPSTSTPQLLGGCDERVLIDRYFDVPPTRPLSAWFPIIWGWGLGWC